MITYRWNQVHGVGVVGAQAGLADVKGAFIQGAGVVEVALDAQDDGEVVEALLDTSDSSRDCYAWQVSRRPFLYLPRGEPAMAYDGDASGAANLEEHPLVRTRATGGNEPTSVRLIGYLARDPDPGYWRVYFSPQLESYVRVPEQDIVSNEVLARDEGPMARTVVHVNNVTELDQVTPLPRQVQAGFLGGDFVSKISPGMSAATPTQATMASLIPILISIIIIEATTPPPLPTQPEGSLASCCLCWTPEPTCPTPPLS